MSLESFTQELIKFYYLHEQEPSSAEKEHFKHIHEVSNSEADRVFNEVNSNYNNRLLRWQINKKRWDYYKQQLNENLKPQTRIFSSKKLGDLLNSLEDSG